MVKSSKLTFQAFALCQSKASAHCHLLWWRAHAWNVSLETLYGGQFAFVTQLIKPKLSSFPHWCSNTISLKNVAPFINADRPEINSSIYPFTQYPFLGWYQTRTMFETVKIRIYTSQPHEKPADQQQWFLKLFISSRITEGTQPEVDSLPLLGSLQEDMERTDNRMQTSHPWRELVTPQLPLNVSLLGSEKLKQSGNINGERWQKILYFQCV